MKRLLTLLLLITFSACQNDSSAPPPEAKSPRVAADSLTAVLTEMQEKGVINGFGVAIVGLDSILYQGGFGFADADAKVAYTHQTIQNIASISKTLIGIALLKAQELGHLTLDDPISDYLPFEVKNPHFPDQPITIRQLTTHTSSIQDTDSYDHSYVATEPLEGLDTTVFHIPDDFQPPSTRISMGEFLQNTLSTSGKWYSEESFLQASPGQTFEYTNVGATLAAYVLEQATGEDYAAFTTQHILQPLGMEASGWSFTDIDPAQHSKLYARPHLKIPFYTLITYPDGGFITSPNNLGIYLMELMRGHAGKGTILSEESYVELFRAQLSDEHFTEERDAENPYDDEYNFGTFMGLSALDYIGHTGGDPGVSSFMFFHTEDHLGRILIINTDLIDQAGFDQFFGIWNTLEAYQERL